jgi:hypothetical protein
MKRAQLAVFLALLPVVPLSAASDGLQEGRVLEAETETPIAGAIVVVRWQDRTLRRSPAGCLHVESAVTDENGQYRSAGWQLPSAMSARRVEPIVTVYKPGYVQIGRPRGRGTTQYLRPWAREREARLDYLSYLNRLTECPASDGSWKSLLTLKQALHQEAIAIAESDAEKVLAGRFGYSAGSIERGMAEQPADGQ